MEKINTILLLSGGDSTRFWPLTDKNLLMFLGKTLLEHQLRSIAPYSHKIIIVSNNQNIDKTRKIVTDLQSTLECEINCLVQDSNLEGQGGAILSAENFLKGEVLILNTNDIFDFSILKEVINTRQNDNYDFLFLAKKVTDYFPGGYVEFNGDKIIGIKEKPSPDNVPSDIVKLVVDYFKDSSLIVSSLKETKTDSDDWYEKALSLIILQNKKTNYIVYSEDWYTLKYPWHILEMQNYFLASIKETKFGKNVKVAKTASIDGLVHIGDDVEIGDFAKIVGPCFIDKKTIVGSYAMVRSSHVGKNCVIGGYSEVTRSYIGDNVMLHRNYVGDSVLAENVMMGAEAVTANYRFDGKEICSMIKDKKVNSNKVKLGAIIGKSTKIGVNCTTLPGIKIGSSCFLGPHSLISEDIEENTFSYKGKKVKNLKISE